jgi:hypothetical protein
MLTRGSEGAASNMGDDHAVAHDKMHFLTMEVRRSPYLSEEGQKEFIQYFTDLMRAHDGPNPNSASKALRQELLDKLPALLNGRGSALQHPAALVSDLYYSGVIKQARRETLSKIQSNMAVKAFTIDGCKDANCKWCQANQRIEMSTRIDVEALLEKHCTCTSYCKCYIKPIISFS